MKRVKPFKPKKIAPSSAKERLERAAASALPYNYLIEPLRVLDGDTLEVRFDLGFNIRMTDFVRLYDVNTPEVSGKFAEARGKIAAEFTSNWLKGGKEFRCDSRKYNAREKYGRVLGEIWRDVDPVSLNEALRNAGHVKSVRRRSADPIAKLVEPPVQTGRRRKAA